MVSYHTSVQHRKNIYTRGHSSVVADALTRKICVEAVRHTTPISNFSLEDLSKVQREHHFWKRVIYALESGDDIQLPELPIRFSPFFLSQDRILCRYWLQKTIPVEQLIIPDKLVPQVLNLIHDFPIAGHPGREKTLAAARKRYYCPTL